MHDCFRGKTADTLDAIDYNKQEKIRADCSPHTEAAHRVVRAPTPVPLEPIARRTRRLRTQLSAPRPRCRSISVRRTRRLRDPCESCPGWHAPRSTASGEPLPRHSRPLAATNRRRSKPTASSRPESRRLHPVGALARPHWKEAAPSTNISTDKKEDPPDDSTSHPEARTLLSGE